MPRFARPCLSCGALVNEARCKKCGTPLGRKTPATPTRTPDQEATLKAKKQYLYGGDYAKRAKLIRETATHCHLCGKPFTPGDRIEADHLNPELGHRSALAPAHRKCNQARGNQALG